MTSDLLTIAIYDFYPDIVIIKTILKKHTLVDKNTDIKIYWRPPVKLRQVLVGSKCNPTHFTNLIPSMKSSLKHVYGIQCNNKKCRTCTMINTTDEKLICFKIRMNYSIKQHYICTSSNIVNIIELSYHKQHIGEIKKTL